MIRKSREDKKKLKLAKKEYKLSKDLPSHKEGQLQLMKAIADGERNCTFSVVLKRL